MRITKLHCRSAPRPARRHRTTWLRAAFLAIGVGLGATTAQADPRPSIAMHGEPRYADGFTHFDYADPEAPKGGTLTLGVLGSYDSLNPFIVKGNAASGLRGGIADDNVYESLMVRGYDEPFTLYALVAASIDVPDDRSRVTFQIDPRARVFQTASRLRPMTSCSPSTFCGSMAFPISSPTTPTSITWKRLASAA